MEGGGGSDRGRKGMTMGSRGAGELSRAGVY